MAKKYVPSGYQIIDLGSLTTATYDVGDNPNVDKLIEWFKKDDAKPILLKGVLDSYPFVYFGGYSESDDKYERRISLITFITGADKEIDGILFNYVKSDEQLYIGIENVMLGE